MRRPEAAVVWVATLSAWCTAMLAASVLTAAGATSSVEQEIERLAGELLRHPGRDSLAAKLADLHEQEAEQRDKALKALDDGLTAYLQGRPSEAAKRLTEAKESRAVADLAGASLPLSLDKIIEACEAPASATARHANLCPVCGGTAMADCSPKVHGRSERDETCHGTGWLLCRRCNGRGELSGGTPSPRHGPLPRHARQCPDCGGVGAIKCHMCGGRGIVPCVECGGVKTAVDARPNPASVDAKLCSAIAALIAKARYLRRGGVDLETPEALAPSPKLGAPKP